jgi:hypothetical protein
MQQQALTTRKSSLKLKKNLTKPLLAWSSSSGSSRWQRSARTAATAAAAAAAAAYESKHTQLRYITDGDLTQTAAAARRQFSHLAALFRIAGSRYTRSLLRVRAAAAAAAAQPVQRAQYNHIYTLWHLVYVLRRCFLFKRAAEARTTIRHLCKYASVR